MPDLLLICRDDQSCFELESLARQKGVRCKTSFDLRSAEDWLRLRSFDGLFIDASFSLEAQEKLGGLLWKLNALASFLVFDLDPESTITGKEARLFGAEVARGKDARQALAACLERLMNEEKLKPQVRADNFKVMVVEDLDSPRDIICMYVEALGFPLVSGWPSAQSALTELLSHPADYSCIITDIRMPEISGQELIRKVREKPELEQIPIIVLTAYGTVDCLIDCLEAGVSGFLVKPPKKQDLNRELARALRMKAHGLSPRLVTPEDAEQMRDLLVDKGFM